MNKKPPSTLEDHLGYWLRCLSNFVSHSFAERVERHGVSVAQWVVLRTLYDRENITLVEVAQLVGVDKSSLSRMMERLVAKNLVIRSDNAEDGRAMNLRLSAAGHKLVPVLAGAADENDNHFFQSLSKRQKEEFLNTIKALLEANGWDAGVRGKDRME